MGNLEMDSSSEKGVKLENDKARLKFKLLRLDTFLMVSRKVLIPTFSKLKRHDRKREWIGKCSSCANAGEKISGFHRAYISRVYTVSPLPVGLILKTTSTDTAKKSSKT